MADVVVITIVAWLAMRRHAKELRKACGYRRLLSSTSMDEPEEEQDSFSGRSLRQVSGKCYFAQQRLCGRCGGNNDCRLACNRRHAKELHAKPVVIVGCYHRLQWTSLRRNKNRLVEGR